MRGPPPPRMGMWEGQVEGRRRGRGMALTGRAPSGRWSPAPAAARSGLGAPAGGRVGGASKQAGWWGGGGGAGLVLDGLGAGGRH